jgi:hypothetical protein
MRLQTTLMPGAQLAGHQLFACKGQDILVQAELPA